MKKIVIASAAILLAACGDEVTEVTNIYHSGFNVVDSVKDLPKCTDDNEGDQAFVKKESSARICVDGDWVPMAPDVGNSDFSCKTEELKDKSGLKIVCNGDSIGVVLNGEKGDAGKDGKDGDDGKDGEDGKDAVLPNDTLEADSERVPISLDSLVGYTQKGPFVKGSTVYLYELSDGRTLKQTNGNFTSNIARDDGRYKFLARDLVSQYAMIVVDGYYRNEVTGEPSAAPIRLKAITDMRKHNSVNVNILTHLEFERVYHLVTKGDSTGKKLTVKQAKKQAQKDILKLFYIELDESEDAEDMDVFGSSDADAALLAISILLQGDRSEMEMMALLSQISTDIAETGEWNDSLTRAKMADWVFSKDQNKFRRNVGGWGLGAAGRFERYLDNFISKTYGIKLCTEEGSDGLQEVKNRFSKFNGKKYECARWNQDPFGNKTWIALRDNPYLGEYENRLIDWRNRNLYRIKQISYFTVMAENLDLEYEVNGKPYGNLCRDDSCKIYGRYYSWGAAMDSAGVYSKNGEDCGNVLLCKVRLPVRGVCPEGWHIPSTDDWFGFYIDIYTLYGKSDSTNAARVLQAKGFDKWPDATNTTGFSALPAGSHGRSSGYFEIAPGFKLAGNDSLDFSYAAFWSSSEYNEYYAYSYYLDDSTFHKDSTGFGYPPSKAMGKSVRCFKDFE